MKTLTTPLSYHNPIKIQRGILAQFVDNFCMKIPLNCHDSVIVFCVYFYVLWACKEFL